MNQPTTTSTPVTPPLQQGSLHFNPDGLRPPFIAPTDDVGAKEVRMKNTSYAVSSHVIHIESLDSDSDSDFDRSDVTPTTSNPANSSLELHPSIILPNTLPSPLPPELVARIGLGSGRIKEGGERERGLILYRPLQYGIEDDEQRGEDARERELLRRRDERGKDHLLAKRREEMEKEEEMEIESGIGLGIVEHGSRASGREDMVMMDIDD